jgi:hypothetical protein
MSTNRFTVERPIGELDERLTTPGQPLVVLAHPPVLVIEDVAGSRATSGLGVERVRPARDANAS